MGRKHVYGIDVETNIDVRDPNDVSKLRLGASIIDDQESIHLAFALIETITLKL